MLKHCLSPKNFIPNFVAFFVLLEIVISCIHKMLFSVTSAKQESTPAGHCFIIPLSGDGQCPLVRDSEPIRLLEIPSSPSLYMLILYIGRMDWGGGQAFDRHSRNGGWVNKNCQAFEQFFRMPRVCPGGMLAAGIDLHNIGELVTSIPFSIMNEDHFSVIVFSCLHGCSKALVPYKFTRGSVFLKVTIKKETDRKSTACNAQLVSIFIYDFKKLLFQSVHLCCIFQNFKLNNKL